MGRAGARDDRGQGAAGVMTMQRRVLGVSTTNHQSRIARGGKTYLGQRLAAGVMGLSKSVMVGQQSITA